MALRNYLRQLKTETTTLLNWSYPYSKPSYSQEGEDLILQRIFANKNNGFYVDVGAHHPFRYSNTHLLYQQGWRGINIEPTPQAIKYFNRSRKRDINLNLAISNTQQNLTLYMFEDSALNTFDPERMRTILSSKQSNLIKKTKINTEKLADVFKKYLPKHQKIDLMNIDVEGFELNVLNSNNWSTHKPQVVLIENLNNSKINQFINKLGYHTIARTLMTEFFQLQK